MALGATDRVFASPRHPASGFTFDENVTAVFDDMLERSIPFYREVQRITTELARRHVHSGSCVYDVGCSIGTTLLLLHRAIEDDSISYVGIDSSPSMLAECARRLSELGDAGRVRLMSTDIGMGLTIADASVVVMNYTLQFVRPSRRESVLATVHGGLRPGGCLLLTEKVLADSAQLNGLYVDLYYELKRRNGYSDAEIVNKRVALENVLVPFTVGENIDLLHRSGFTTIDVVFRWYNFVTYLAVK